MAVDWLKIKTEYIKDPTTTVDKLAEKHGINASYARYVAGKEKWGDQRETTQQKASDRLAEILPETIAEVKARHARAGRIMQQTALQGLVGKDGKPLIPTSYEGAINAIVKGIQVERTALDLNSKEVMDEVMQKFQSFTFIFHLKDDELLRFINTIDTQRAIEAESVSDSTLPTAPEGEGNSPVVTAGIPEQPQSVNGGS